MGKYTFWEALREWIKHISWKIFLWSIEMTADQYLTSVEESRQFKLEDALHEIANWADAYPLEVFPEFDFKKAREVLEKNGMTLDAISASNMRHVITRVSEIAKEALKHG